ncbi:hypothetical protein HG535_0G01330 [Zygotorulaspora mrakii]|uniref:Uncharacterized protein n=1 Tax=Zygotorulaspora mrakii TaxID=42260 RepID=A0A7H9B8E0_ZYGMR|nr:uncharacterized protein HG535_0G01330 [Zygotorulaspora mrakii]QLG74249.1 hypothetical protein HG535_0G01330 [Zygotorulaspora mrakii]
MESHSLNTPAGYLPTKKSQLVSQARIAKINELYKRKNKEHRDSVVSNNSTSVLSNTTNSNDCAPVFGLKYKPNNNGYHLDEPTATVKQEVSEPNLFNFTVPPQQPSPSTSSDVGTSDNRQQKLQNRRPVVHNEDDDEDYEAELKFTPRLKSRRSLIISSNLGDSDGDFENEMPERLRRPAHGSSSRNRRLSLKKALGDPLPLPYVNKDFENSSNGNDTVLTDEAFNEKRRLIEKKWRYLVSPGKRVAESRFKENKEYHDSNNSPFSIFKSELSASSSNSALATGSHEIMKSLKEEIISNRDKLDRIVDLLNNQNKIRTTNSNYSEYSFWIFCIILLIFFNIYVYYY